MFKHTNTHTHTHAHTHTHTHLVEGPLVAARITDDVIDFGLVLRVEVKFRVYDLGMGRLG